MRKTFDREGFVLIPSVFTSAQIEQLRSAADIITGTPTDHPSDTHEHPGWGTTRGDLFARYPQFQWVLFHEPLSTLHQVLSALAIDDTARAR